MYYTQQQKSFDQQCQTVFKQRQLAQFYTSSQSINSNNNSSHLGGIHNHHNFQNYYLNSNNNSSTIASNTVGQSVNSMNILTTLLMNMRINQKNNLNANNISNTNSINLSGNVNTNNQNLSNALGQSLYSQTFTFGNDKQSRDIISKDKIKNKNQNFYQSKSKNRKKLHLHPESQFDIEASNEDNAAMNISIGTFGNYGSVNNNMSISPFSFGNIALGNFGNFNLNSSSLSQAMGLLNQNQNNLVNLNNNNVSLMKSKLAKETLRDLLIVKLYQRNKNIRKMINLMKQKYDQIKQGFSLNLKGISEGQNDLLADLMNMQINKDKKLTGEQNNISQKHDSLITEPAKNTIKDNSSIPIQNSNVTTQPIQQIIIKDIKSKEASQLDKVLNKMKIMTAKVKSIQSSKLQYTYQSYINKMIQIFHQFNLQSNSGSTGNSTGNTIGGNITSINFTTSPQSNLNLNNNFKGNTKSFIQKQRRLVQLLVKIKKTYGVVNSKGLRYFKLHSSDYQNLFEMQKKQKVIFYINFYCQKLLFVKGQQCIQTSENINLHMQGIKLKTNKSSFMDTNKNNAIDTTLVSHPNNISKFPKNLLYCPIILNKTRQFLKISQWYMQLLNRQQPQWQYFLLKIDVYHIKTSCTQCIFTSYMQYSYMNNNVQINSSNMSGGPGVNTFQDNLIQENNSNNPINNQSSSNFQNRKMPATSLNLMNVNSNLKKRSSNQNPLQNKDLILNNQQLQNITAQDIFLKTLKIIRNYIYQRMVFDWLACFLIQQSDSRKGDQFMKQKVKKSNKLNQKIQEKQAECQQGEKDEEINKKIQKTNKFTIDIAKNFRIQIKKQKNKNFHINKRKNNNRIHSNKSHGVIGGGSFGKNASLYNHNQDQQQQQFRPQFITTLMAFANENGNLDKNKHELKQKLTILLQNTLFNILTQKTEFRVNFPTTSCSLGNNYFQHNKRFYARHSVNNFLKQF